VARRRGAREEGLAPPQFFCETCGAEVPLDVDNCPSCGSTFTSVKCPRCHHEGPSNTFAVGCPSCGLTPPGFTAPRPAPQIRSASLAPRRPPSLWLIAALSAVLVGLVMLLLGV
tara:strand:+ start:20 stop:361 length:342 start_codon:yes stop_codon:yes gene_type:complete